MRGDGSRPAGGVRRVEGGVGGGGRGDVHGGPDEAQASAASARAAAAHRAAPVPRVRRRGSRVRPSLVNFYWARLPHPSGIPSTSACGIAACTRLTRFLLRRVALHICTLLMRRGASSFV